MKSVKQSQKSRRHFLRGAGIALALPWMESLPLFGAQDGSGGGRRRYKPPLRFGVIYFSKASKRSTGGARQRNQVQRRIGRASQR